MISRRVLLAGSIILSMAVHGALFVFAPDIAILSGGGRAEAVIEAYRFRLSDHKPMQLEPKRSETYSSGLATKPETVEDLLQRETVDLKPLEELLLERVEVPMLRERVAAESLERSRDLTPQPELLAKLDSDIIEISQQRAKDNISIDRRFVAPSPGRTLNPDEFPTIRDLGSGNMDERIEYVPFVIERGGSRGAAHAESPLEVRPPPREDALSAVRPASPPEGLLPELAIESVETRTLNSDFGNTENRFLPMDEVVDLRLDTYVPPGETKGFFRLRIVPKDGEAIETLPKDVTFVIDASSSILQRKLRESIDAVQKAIRNLNTADHFNVVVFRETPSTFRSERVPATDGAKEEAVAFIEGLEARGETNVYEAIRPEVLRPPRTGVPGIVLLVSDGKPTQGLLDGRDIINALTEENARRNSIFTVAAGRSVNRYLLDLLAYRNRGETQVIDEISEIETNFPRFFDRFSEPILVDCRVDYGSLTADGIYPQNIPDFYRGQAVTVFGEFDPERDRGFALRLTGRAGESEKEVIFRADLSDAESGDESIARLWAHRKIYHLIGEICRVGETPELKAELQQLSQRYNVRTIYSE